MRVFVILLFTFLISFGASAQRSKNKKEKDRSAPTSLDPSTPNEQYVPKKAMKGRSKGPTYESEQQYYERMASLEKQRRKNEKMMEKPQYADPMYFGHKRPPKKHKAGKLKFCKECGMRH